MNPTAPSPLDWADLYTEYQTKIYAYILRRTSSHLLADDLTADTFAKAIDSTQRGKGAIESFSGWIYRIAHNLIIDHYRERDGHQQVSIDEVWHMPDEDNNPAVAAERTLDAEMLNSALQRMTPDQATALVLRYIHGCEYSEMAEQMGKTEGAVKALVHRAHDAAHALINNGDTRPPRKEGCRDKVRGALLLHGPMTTGELMAATHQTKGAVGTALYQFPQVFARVGTRARGKISIVVWGVVDIHDTENA